MTWTQLVTDVIVPALQPRGVTPFDDVKDDDLAAVIDALLREFPAAAAKLEIRPVGLGAPG